MYRYNDDSTVKMWTWITTPTGTFNEPTASWQSPPGNWFTRSEIFGRYL
ncbi:hypothetical protein [Streptomyces sp. NBC_01508]